ncbi:MAG: TauD/TfdA family dioxygenase [Rhodospirillales bacterium]|nr:TauD/TfdA family dioxygenase [Acetobacter sp.]
MGLGSYFGYFVSQNGRGHVLGHVKDLGEDASQPDKVRIYRTNAKQFFHTDGTDLVGLLCIAKALEGGESDIASTHHVFNTLQREHPDVVETLCTPNWYFDRKGEVGEGMDPWYVSAIMFLEHAPDGTPRMWSKFDPMNVTSLSRFSEGPDARIPPLSEKQKHALKVPLATDADGSVCEAFGTWIEKSMYGRKYMGIDRATFLIGGDDRIARMWRKVKVPGHAEEVLAAARALKHGA